MNKLYLIGEVAKIMGVSVQTLRYYSNIGLVVPEYINPETGYRYYSPNQLHYIDRIRYLQKFGLNLEDIKKVIHNNDIPLLLDLLEEQKNTFVQEIAKLNNTIDDIEWYKNYFTYVDVDKLDSHCYIKHFTKRQLVATKCIPKEPKTEFHIRLNEIKHSKKFRNLTYHRQFSYILDYESILKNAVNPYYLGMFIKDDMGITSQHILEIPQGDYLCFKSRILSETWNPYFIKLFFEGKAKPTLVLANEYEDSFQDYSTCVYEVQIFIGRNDTNEIN